MTIANQILEGLDPEQTLAVIAPTDTAILVLAGAGSGKTTVLARRAAYLVSHFGYSPSAIVATTFTRDAASEIKSRVSALIGASAADMQISTIHSLCLRILRTHLRRVEIIESASQRKILWGILEEIYRKLGIPEEDSRYLPYRYWQSWIDWAKSNHMWAEDEFLWKMEQSRPDMIENKLYSKIASEALASYEGMKGSLYDMSDMILEARKLIQSDPAVLESLRRNFHYVLIDEVQDTSRNQMDILQAISQDRGTMLIGDGDQALYVWRDADPSENIFGFRDFYPTGSVLQLGTNYRSSQRIVSGAKALIHQNYLAPEKAEFEKNIRPRPDAPEGRETQFFFFIDDQEEADNALSQIKKLMSEENYQPRDIYVLSRIKAALALVEEKLVYADIPAVSAGGSYWDNNRVQDVVCILRLAHHINDDEAFLRVFDIPSPAWDKSTRRLGKKFIEELNTYRSVADSLWQCMLHAYPTQRPFRQAAIDDFTDMMRKIRDSIAEYAFSDVVEEVSNYYYREYYLRRNGADAEEDLEILEPLVRFASRSRTWEGMVALMDRMKAASENKSEAEAVVLSTIHGVKGLERLVVIGIGMSEGIFPHWLVTGEPVMIRGVERSRATMPPSSYDGDIQDERCAAYVLCTRAKDRLFLSGSSISGAKGDMQPSRFLRELNPEVFTPRRIVREGHEDQDDEEYS